MSAISPLKPDEILFTYRLLFETLNFAEPIKKTAETKFRNLGLSNGAIENFLRVLKICEYTMLAKIYEGHEPPTVGFCPWKTPAAFHDRVAEVQDWLNENGSESCDVEIFIHKEQHNQLE